MTVLDLVAGAERRAGIADALGALLLVEPSPTLGALVEGIAELRPLVAPDQAAVAAIEFERVLLREVTPYASVFLGDDGRRGGPVADAVAESYDAAGFTEHREHVWRAPGPDHLGLVLRCYATLCREEAAGWSSDHPERATRAVESTRAYLHRHLGWAVLAGEAIADASGANTPYGHVGSSVVEFLHAESNLLRPDPDHGPVDDDVAPPAPGRTGPHRLARRLLSPRLAGGWLSRSQIAAVAQSHGLAWRPSDPRGNLRFVIQSVMDSDELPPLARDFSAIIESWSRSHADRERTHSGAARTWREWRNSAETTATLLQALADGAPLGASDRAAVTTLEVSGILDEPAERAIQQAIDHLTRAGLTVRWSEGGDQERTGD